MTKTQGSIDPLTMTGLEQLQAISAGLLPPAPIGATIGMENFAPEHGSMSIELVVEPRHYNPIGTVHGGVLSTMLDTVAGCSVHSTLAVGEAYTSLDLTVKFLRPATVASGRLRAVGRVLHRGRRTALAEGQVFDAAGRLVAHATSSCMIFEPTAPAT